MLRSPAGSGQIRRSCFLLYGLRLRDGVEMSSKLDVLFSTIHLPKHRYGTLAVTHVGFNASPPSSSVALQWTPPPFLRTSRLLSTPEAFRVGTAACVAQRGPGTAPLFRRRRPGPHRAVAESRPRGGTGPGPGGASATFPRPQAGTGPGSGGASATFPRPQPGGLPPSLPRPTCLGLGAAPPLPSCPPGPGRPSAAWERAGGAEAGAGPWRREGRWPGQAPGGSGGRRRRGAAERRGGGARAGGPSSGAGSRGGAGQVPGGVRKGGGAGPGAERGWRGGG